MSRLMFSINPPSTSLELTLLDSAYLEKYFCLLIYLVCVSTNICVHVWRTQRTTSAVVPQEPPTYWPVPVRMLCWLAHELRCLLVSAFPALWLQTSISDLFLTQVLGDKIRVLWFTKQIFYWLSYHPNSVDFFFNMYLFIYLLAYLFRQGLT